MTPLLRAAVADAGAFVLTCTAVAVLCVWTCAGVAVLCVWTCAVVAVLCVWTCAAVAELCVWTCAAVAVLVCMVAWVRVTAGDVLERALANGVSGERLP